MTSRAIEKIEKVIATIGKLEGSAVTPVERVDLSDIRSDLASALEKLEALRTYQEDDGTDYGDLWEIRKDDMKQFEESRDAWVRTEIFSMLLKPTFQ